MKFLRGFPLVPASNAVVARRPGPPDRIRHLTCAVPGRSSRGRSTPHLLLSLSLIISVVRPITDGCNRACMLPKRTRAAAAPFRFGRGSIQSTHRTPPQVGPARCVCTPHGPGRGSRTAVRNVGCEEVGRRLVSTTHQAPGTGTAARQILVISCACACWFVSGC